jgi:HPt (histidine-containing phosphotransfer) domain-containing protein
MTTSPARKPELAVLDLRGALERVGDDQALLHEIAEIFLHDGPRLVEDLQAALSAGDGRQIERSAHALKGIAANVGGLRVERAALAVEDAARSGQSELAGIAAQQLGKEFARLIEALRATVCADGHGDAG